MTTTTSSAALASIGASSRALALPTIRTEAEPLAQIAVREHQTHLAYLAEFLAAEVDERTERRRARRIGEAKFPRLKRLADFNLDAAPTISPPTLAHLATGTYLHAGEPVVLLGPPGIGKTHCETHGGGLAGLLGAEVAESVRVIATDSKVSLTRWPRAAVSSLWICRRGHRHRPGPPSLA